MVLCLCTVAKQLTSINSATSKYAFRKKTIAMSIQQLLATHIQLSFAHGNHFKIIDSLGKH